MSDIRLLYTDKRVNPVRRNMIVFPGYSLTATLLQTGMGFEIMDKQIAYRTCNILVKEDRQNVAAMKV